MRHDVFRSGLRGVLLLSILTLPALADEKKYPIDRWLEKEIKRNPSTMGMRRATLKAETMWDAAMNKTYQKAKSGMTPSQRAALVKAQKAWLAFRDAEFEAHRALMNSRQGTIWPLLMDEHRLTVVRDRALQLKSYARSLESDE